MQRKVHPAQLEESGFDTATTRLHGRSADCTGFKPDPSKVEAILKLESSKTKVVEAAVKSDKRLRNKTAKGLDHFYLGLLAKRKILRGGETRLLLERDQKRDQAKSKDLELFSQYFVVSSRAQKNINLDFSLEQFG